MHYHSFQEDLLHELFGYRGETDWPIVPTVFFFPLFKTGNCFSSFQSVKNALHCHNYLDMINSLGISGVVVGTLQLELQPLLSDECLPFCLQGCVRHVPLACGDGHRCLVAALCVLHIPRVPRSSIYQM